MERQIPFVPVKTGAQLEAIRIMVPTNEELLQHDRHLMGRKLAADLTAMSEAELHGVAYTLKPSEVELLLLSIGDDMDTLLVEKIELILAVRFRRKLVDLCWEMVQRNVQSIAIRNTFRTLVECLKERQPEVYEETLFSQLGSWQGDLVAGIHRYLASQDLDLTLFFQKYAVKESLPLGIRVSELFFAGCDKKGFLCNREMFITVMQGLEQNSAASLFSNYLTLLKPDEQLDEVNQYVADRFGEETGFWNGISETLAEQFFKWRDLKRIRMHFRHEEKKYMVWTEFSGQIKSTYHSMKDQLLILDFGDHIMVDRKDHPGDSLLYTGESFSRIDERIADAREFILDGAHADIYRLSYEGVNLLYLKELLRIKLSSEKNAV